MSLDMEDDELKSELQIGMGGGLLNELIERIELKRACLSDRNESLGCEKIENLKMYVYSSVRYKVKSY
jgi:hypothetical protein